MKMWLGIVVVAVTLGASRLAVGADSGLLGAEEESLLFGYGRSTRASLDFYTFGPRLAFDFPRVIPPIAGNRLRIAIEVLGSVISDGRVDGELALNPLLFNYRLDLGYPVVPFFEGGEGIILTSLRALELGGTFQFGSQFGGGLQIFLTRHDALVVGGRFRHMSNAGIRSENRGLNTWWLTLGWSRFPSRS
jgi:hypothetical protein